MSEGKFDAASRYGQTEIATRTEADGSVTKYLRRRFIPRPSGAPELAAHYVSEGDRIDRIAARTLGDPLLWWRIADANRALDPAALTVTLGRRLRIAIDDGTTAPGSETGQSDGQDTP